ncbi:hypothetical protein KR222_000106, partial [Zaprionus bogoriensis]
QNAADVAAYRAKQQECIKELNVPASEAALITSDKDVPNPSSAYKCYHSCLYKKLGLLSADNKRNDGAIVKLCQARFSNVSQDKITQGLQKCAASTPTGPTECDFVYNFEMCVVKALTA